MKPTDLVLKGYAERDKNGMWHAVCLDFCLSTQGDSFEEVMKKMHEQIRDYIEDAVVGEDKAHVEYLFNRKAPAHQWIKYYGYGALCKLHIIKNGFAKLFREPLPLTLVPNHKAA